jgi:hypothetical protein
MSFFYGHGVPQSYQQCKKYLEMSISKKRKLPTKKMDKKEKRSLARNLFQKNVRKAIPKKSGFEGVMQNTLE